MEKVNRSQLFKKTFGIIVIIFVAITVITSLFFSWTLKQNLFNEYKSKGIAIAQSITDASVDLILHGNLETIQSILNQFQAIEGVAYVMVQDASGEIISHTFIPAIPTEIAKLADTHHHEKGQLEEPKTIKTLNINKFGHVIHIASPIIFGEVGFVYVGMETRSIEAVTQAALAKLFLAILVVFLLSIALLFVIISKIAQPLKELTDYANALADHDFESLSDSHKNIQIIQQQSKDEIGALAGAFSNLETKLISYIKNLKDTTAEKERIQSELAVARDIQMSILPNPTENEKKQLLFDIELFIQPAKEVGGDFYDYLYKEDEGLLYFTIGDVSGKGVPAALFMAMTATLLKSTIANQGSPSEILASVNRGICKNNDSCLFVTVFLGVLNLHTGELEYALAGHPPPYVISPDGSLRELELTNGMALGIDENEAYQSKKTLIPAESALFTYTDGVTDMRDKNDVLFDAPNVERFLSDSKTTNIETIARNLVNEISTFTKDTDQYDDITALILKRREGPVKISNKLTVFFENELSELEKLQQVVEMFCSANTLPDRFKTTLNVVFEELIGNIISYGYEDHDPHKIFLKFDLEGDLLKAVIEDDGIPFNPLEAPEVDTSQSLDDMPIGGLGIHFVKTLMDDLSYERQESKNILTLTKSVTEKPKSKESRS